MINANKKFDGSHIRINCRLSYCHLFEPRETPKGDKKYDCCLIVPKTDTLAVKLIHEALESAQAQYTEKFGKAKSKLKNTVKDGDEERPDDATVAGCYYINTSAPRAPGLKMLEGGILVDALDDDDIYSGCYAAADINFSPYCNKEANAYGIGCYINNVLKLEDGEKLAGGMSADEAFADLT